jgi:hypothetical protein
LRGCGDRDGDSDGGGDDDVEDDDGSGCGDRFIVDGSLDARGDRGIREEESVGEERGEREGGGEEV